MDKKAEQYARDYPAMYGLYCGSKDFIKNGSSWHIANRKAGAFPYSPTEPIFGYVIILEKEFFRRKSDLYILDSKFVDFIKEKSLSEYYLEEGGGTEWYRTSCPQSYLSLRLEFLQQEKIPILDVLTEDIFPIRDLTVKDSEELKEEDKAIRKKDIRSRWKELDTFQQPHIQVLRNAILSSNPEAGLVTAVCGYGKTVVVSKAMKDAVDRIIICVPNDHLKDSWRKALLTYTHFEERDIVDLNKKKLMNILKRERFAILLCYASSHILHDVLDDRVELAIFDEAHRLAGIAQVVQETTETEEQKRDIGRTKRLVRKCANLRIQRLSLTFTPKGFEIEDECKDIINSNDDKILFGEPLVQVSLREMIDRKLLPPYEIRFPLVKKMYEGVKAKVQLMLHEYMKQENEMNKLIAFGRDHKECREICAFIQELLPETNNIKVIYLDSSESVTNGVKQFKEAERAILVNCMLLGEGSDIPEADSVCILCNKESYIQIVQNLLRPGRYYEAKEKFYMIMALNDDDDAEFVGYALDALSKIDPHLDKQLVTPLLNSTMKGEKPHVEEDLEYKSLTEIIQSEGVAWYDVPAIRRCIEGIIRRRTQGPLTRGRFDTIRKSCILANVTNSSGYDELSKQYGWPEAIWRNRDMTAYDFFHPNHLNRIEVSEIKALLQKKRLLLSQEYKRWQTTHQEFPTLEDINDGYFGSSFTNFQTLVPEERRRR